MTPADAVVVLAATALVGALFALRGPGEAAARARILVDGEPVREIALDAETTITVTGAQGESRLAVADGAIRFVASPCNGQYCVHSGWHRHGGELVACLPNRVSVQVLGRRFDSINF